MHRLWSPWRSQPLERHLDTHRPDPQDERTLFEQIAADDDDEANLVLWRGEHVFALMNLYPYNNGHILVVPYRSVTAYTDLTTEERHALADTIDRVMRWQTEAFCPDGFNVGINIGQAGGAGVPDHLHAHVLPRWAADTNFMSTTAQVKVIPEALEESYRKVRACVRQD